MDTKLKEPARGESETDSDTYQSFGNGAGYGAKLPSSNVRKRLLAKRKAQKRARKRQRIKK